MPENLYTLKQDSLDLLHRKVKENLEVYKQAVLKIEDFFADESAEDHRYLSKVPICGDSLQSVFGEKQFSEEAKGQIIRDDPFYCAKIYRALSNLTPQQATDPRLWVYLTHFVFWDYARHRWPIDFDKKDIKDKDVVGRIQSHYHLKNDIRQMVRDNAISRLWWMAHICSRVESRRLEDVLRALLFKEDVRKEIIERGTFPRSRPVFRALMKFVLLSFEGNQELHQRGKFRELCKELNRIGGVCVLDSLSESGIEKKVEEIIVGMDINPTFS